MKWETMRQSQWLLTCVAFAFASTLGAFEVVIPSAVPVDRLIRNAKRQVFWHRKSAEAHYTLGRLHYLVFSTGCLSASPLVGAKDGAGAFGDPIPDWPALDEQQRDSRRGWMRAKRAHELAWKELGIKSDAEIKQGQWEAFRAAESKWDKRLADQHWEPAKSLPAAEMIAHAASAAAELNKAVELDPKSSLYLLTLASVTEQAADWCEEMQFKSVPQPLQPLTYEAAKQTYLKAYQLAYVGDAKLQYLPGSKLLSQEAAEGYLRLARGKADPPSEADTVAEVQAGLDKLDKLQEDPDIIRLVTPMVFSVAPVDRLADLLADNVVVDFDLRGYGSSRQRWHWVRPSAGILIWDPERRGQATSGRDLFGNYTFQMFRANGYDALAALDDNNDGMLTGAELNGIRVWFDRDKNGRCEPSEVMDVADLGVVAIATRATSMDGLSPMNPRGVVFRDGHSVASWDWMAESAGD